VKSSFADLQNQDNSFTLTVFKQHCCIIYEISEILWTRQHLYAIINHSFCYKDDFAPQIRLISDNIFIHPSYCLRRGALPEIQWYSLSEFKHGLLTIEISGPHCQRFWFSKSGMEPKQNVFFEAPQIDVVKNH
jgi:hypothetical protein